jgi:hypothetical protein
VPRVGSPFLVFGELVPRVGSPFVVFGELVPRVGSPFLVFGELVPRAGSPFVVFGELVLAFQTDEMCGRSHQRGEGGFSGEAISCVCPASTFIRT